MTKTYTSNDIIRPLIWLHDTASGIVGLPNDLQQAPFRFLETTAMSSFEDLLVSCAEGNYDIKAIILPYEVAFHQIKKIRKVPSLLHVPVIALKMGAEPTMSIIKDALTKGIDDCYLKPVAWATLMSRINDLAIIKPLLGKIELEREKAYRLPFAVRALDVVASSLGILALSPIAAIVSLAIKLESKGPVFYASPRVAGARVIKFWKFRSMRTDADKMLEQLADLNQYNETGEKQVFVKFKNDPRVTRVGRIIRKCSIDELPQLYNVLIGEMSLVGNRPLPAYEAEHITTEDYAERFLAPAGITGLWQVSKRGNDNMSYEERMDLDIKYARTRSTLMDIKLLYKTATGAFMQKENV